MIRSLPSFWETMSQDVKHDKNITTLDDVAHHLELEIEQQEDAKPNNFVYMVESISHWASRPKCKNNVRQ